MEEKNLSFDFKARYYQLGTITEKTDTLWVCLHGQGQLASYFSRKFESLVDDTTAVVIPEGLSRYYLEGFTGRVGALWMTKEDRLTDIENYITYLDTVWNSLPPCNPRRVILLGFSQGAATASRWVTLGKIPATHLILWSGIFPPDLPTNASERIQDLRVLQVYGTKDEYLSDAVIQEQERISKELSAEVNVITFEGPHRVEPDVLATLPLD